MADDLKYHIDHHAALLPPPGLTGDEAVRALAREQRRLCLLSLSDGELHRRNHLAVTYDSAVGFGPALATPTPLARTVGAVLAPEVRPLVGPPALVDDLAAREARALAPAADRAMMSALPSPGYLLELATAASGDVDRHGDDLVGLVRTQLLTLAACGVRYVQVRNPAYAVLLTVEGRRRATAHGLDPEAVVARMLAADTALLEGLELPADTRVGLDITTAGAAPGPWAVGPTEAFLAGQPYGRLLVEHPADVAGRLPLKAVRAGVVLSLGIVPTRGPLPAVEQLLATVDEAATVLPLDDLALAPDGPFPWAVGVDRAAGRAADEAVAHGGAYEDQRRRLRLVETVARYFWGLEL